MSTTVALNHRTVYRYDRRVHLGPQIVRLKPAAHARTRIISYSLKVEPPNHFINWIQDPYGNFLARLVIPSMVEYLQIETDLVAELTVVNPFDFFLDPRFEHYPFDATFEEDLAPYLAQSGHGALFSDLRSHAPKERSSTIEFLVNVNRLVQQAVQYRVRMEQNIQSPEETLRIRSGSCRDSALVLVELLRSYGIPARFVSGYLIQLVPDRVPRTGPKGPEKDFCDLHAWAEAYIPGAGWIGLDPTSGLLAGEGHIPLAATPHPGGASPVEGSLDPAGVDFEFTMSVHRLNELPRATRPFPKGGSVALDRVGQTLDSRLEALGYALTIGGEPTFVSDNDRTAPEWNGEAVGPTKKLRAFGLLRNLSGRWAHGGVVHSAQGKWYPGESLPRWSLSCYWRRDGVPLWKNASLHADERKSYGYTTDDARRFMSAIVAELGVDEKYSSPAYEDPFPYLLQERNLPLNVTAGDSRLHDPEERARFERVMTDGLDKPVGFVLPIQRGSWKSGPWPMRNGRLILIPGDSPIGLRLPLDSLPWASERDRNAFYPRDPQEPLEDAFLRPRQTTVMERTAPPGQRINEQPIPPEHPPLVAGESAAWVIRTALCVQAREGRLYLFFPPVREAEDWFALAACAERAAERCGTPIVLEGYAPPYDPRILSFQITPDPGVIEVNLPPAKTSQELSDRLSDLYDAAEECGLSTERYQLGGQVTGTGGGCHWVLGGPIPSESPFLRRPDLLRSWMTFTNRHPSLSYLFAGLFIGASSQAPRTDESQIESLHDIELAFRELDRHESSPPWLTDRLFRNLLVDSTGNTHRSEICVDKLFSPDSAGGRRGLVEFRSWEMAPHPSMSLSQSLLIRALTLHFLEKPCREPLIRWGNRLRDEWMLPSALWRDFREVTTMLADEGLAFPMEPFEAQWNFRFPLLGMLRYGGIELELRPALEPWPAIGEEPGTGGTVRYVDSSVERVEITVRNWDPGRYLLACRGRQIPLSPLGGDETVFAAGIRFKAWKLPAGLHPTMEVNGTLVIDLIDLFNHRVVAGCTYHVAHPAGRNYEEAPVNSFEAESRRTARFIAEGYTPGPLPELPRLAYSPGYLHTLDLRD